MLNKFPWKWRRVSAGQAAGTHCALSESCVGTTTQRVSCDLSVGALWLGSESCPNLSFGSDNALSGSQRQASFNSEFPTTRQQWTGTARKLSTGVVHQAGWNRR